MNKLLSLSIRKQMVLLVVLMTVVPLGIIAHSAFKQRKHDIEEAKLFVERLAVQISNDQQILLAEIELLSNTLSHIKSVQQRDSKAVNSLLAELIKTNPLYANILITDKTGLVWAGAIPPKEPVSLADRRSFKNSIATGKFSSGEYMVGKIQNVPIISFGYPILDDSGGVAGVIVIGIHLERYGLIIKRGKIPDLTSLVLTDHNGVILFDAIVNQFIGKQDKEEIFKLMSEGPDKGTFEAVGVTGKHRIFAYHKLRLDGEQTPYMYVRVGILAKTVLGKARSELIFNTGLILSIMILTLGFVVYLSKRGILDKITALRDATQQFAQGNYEVRVTDRVSSGEFGELARAFDTMANRLADDNTERKRVEEELRQSEERYRSLFENNPVQTITVDDQGRVTEYNLAKKRSGDRLPKIGDVLYKDYAAKHAIDMYEELMACIKSGELKVFPEQKYRDKYLLVSISPFKEGAIVTSIDITESKQAEEALRESEEFFHNLFNNTEVGLFRTRLDGSEILNANEKFLEIFGRRREEVIGKPSVIHWADPRQREDMVRRLKADGRVIDFECNMLNKKGEVRNCLTSLNLYPEKGILDGSIIDITERKLTEYEIKHAHEQMRAFARRLQAVREEERTNIAREIHDELGGALTGMKIDLSLLTRTVGEIKEESLKHPLSDQIYSMMKLIDKTIKTVRRLAMELRPGILDDLGLLAALEWQLNDFKKRTGIRCEWTSSVEQINMDEQEVTALFRIFQETLTNVIRHAGATEVRVQLSTGEDTYRLEVEDNGRGITGNEIEASNSLGLLGMRERTQSFGGRITVTGHPGRGTKVTVDVPFKEIKNRTSA